MHASSLWNALCAYPSCPDLRREPIVRTTVTLDQDVYDAVMLLSRMSGEPLGSVLSDLVRSALRPPKPPNRQEGRRFPVFEVAAGSPTMRASKIQKLIDGD